MLAALYRELGLTGLELRLNSMGCKECRPGYSAALRDFLPSTRSELCGECRERAELNPLRTFDCKVPGCRAALADAPRLSRLPVPGVRGAPRRGSRQCLDVQGIAFVEDHTLVRGMDYYTRTTFEFQSSLLGAQSGVGGGGRYDDLVEAIGGPATPGVGFGTGVERILLALVPLGGRSCPRRRRPSAYLVSVGERGARRRSSRWRTRCAPGASPSSSTTWGGAPRDR